MKQNFKRFLSWTLALLMALSLLPAGLLTLPAHAASGTVTGLNDPEIGVSYDGGDETTWTAAENKIQGSIAAGKLDFFGKETTLTITNKKKKAAILSFSYTIGNQGTIAVDGSTVTENGQFSKKLNPNGSVTIYLKASWKETSGITLQDILLVVDAKPTVWFQPSENGTYSVDGTQIKEATPSSKNSQTPYQLVAEPNDGYQFQCWYNLSSNKCISTKPSISLNIEDACYITAKFSSEGVNLFYVGEQVIEGLVPAIEYAQQQNIEQVTLQSENALLEGDYVIPSGITLLIPFDEARTLYKSKPIALPNTGSVSAKKNEFKRLTLAEGASITVFGELSVGGKYRAGAGGSPGYMSGNYGQIWLEEGSAITVKADGSLYAWGFVSGAGKVTVESGGSVYEWFQVTDFRGGTATSGMTSGDVFPISQYYVQNIESELILHSGAVEVAYAAIYADSKNYYSSIPFIGQDGMFCLESGTLTKQYDGTTDRINFNLNGVAEVNSLNLELAGTSVSSTTYVLPLTNNMSIELTESSALTVNQTAALLPGTQTNIAQGAELIVANGTSLYVYDAEQWEVYDAEQGDGYCGAGNEKFIPVSYSPSKRYTRAQNDLIDAEIDVNGTLTAAGAIYTTAGGANICSSEGTGVYVQQGASGGEQVTHQCTQTTVFGINKAVSHDIPITPAKLHNGDGSYKETVGTAAGTTINYVNGVWGGTAACMHTEVVDAAVAATCTTSGMTEGKHCSVCNAILIAQTVIPAKGHTEVTDEAVAATCTETGKTEGKHCSVCNEVLVAQEEVPAKGHTEVTDEAVEPTCTEPGKTEGKHCSICNTILVAQQTIPAKGHTEVIDEAVAATCTEPGKTEGKHCSVCNTVLVAQKEIPAKGHTEAIDAAVAATCTEPGKTEGKHCSVCNEVIVAQTVIPAKGHTEVVDAAVAATCMEPGKTEGKHCSVCNAILIAQKVIPAKGHTEVTDAAVASTCTEPGKTEGKHCSVCNEVLTAQTEVPAKGHTEVIDEAVAATCTTPGKTEGKHCSVCNTVLAAQKEIPALNHAWKTEWEKNGEKHWHKCSRCNAVDAEAAHTFGEWRVTKAADYVTPGEKTHTCSVCNAAETKPIPSILQQLKDLEITATKDGYTMTLPTGKKVLVLLAGYSQAGQLQSIQALSANETGEVTFTRPDSEKAMLFFLQEDYKPLCSRKVTQ